MKLKKNKVVVGMTVKNTTKDKLSFFPDQGNVVIGNLQLDADLFNGKGNVGGDIQAGVSKSGVVEYAVPDGKSLDVDKVKEVQLHFGDIFNEKSMDAKPFDQVIKLK
ncbi:MAG TPA: hypothetical protein VNM45_05390 [Bacillus sp. (in: firmicutes)]|nr:hypothetical protein [Bacillus sp. (in: firmicutes)]